MTTSPPAVRSFVVGIVGGGQLARMMYEASIGLGIQVALLAEGPDVSAAQVVRDVTVGDYTDPAVVAVAGQSKGRPLVVIATNAPARDRGVKAGELVRTAAQTLGGGGGGKDDLAQGGGQDPTRIQDALDAVRWRLGELTG